MSCLLFRRETIYSYADAAEYFLRLSNYVCSFVTLILQFFVILIPIHINTFGNFRVMYLFYSYHLTFWCRDPYILHGSLAECWLCVFSLLLLLYSAKTFWFTLNLAVCFIFLFQWFMLSLNSSNAEDLSVSRPSNVPLIIVRYCLFQVIWLYSYLWVF